MFCLRGHRWRFRIWSETFSLFIHGAGLLSTASPLSDCLLRRMCDWGRPTGASRELRSRQDGKNAALGRWISKNPPADARSDPEESAATSPSNRKTRLGMEPGGQMNYSESTERFTVERKTQPQGLKCAFFHMVSTNKLTSKHHALLMIGLTFP